MKKIIFIVEDSIDEILIAKKIIIENGFTPVFAETLQDYFRILDGNLKDRIIGIITDLHFPYQVNGNKLDPNGLAVVTRALLENIPVSICSDIDHHQAMYLKNVIMDLEKMVKKKIHFTMDKKNWEEALKNLI